MIASAASRGAPEQSRRFLADVVEGLSSTPKRVPPFYFYDEVGSALFEAITALDEYGLTRADERLLRRHAPDVARIAGGRAHVVELGSGSGRKTRAILEAFNKPPYHAIDVSAASLEHCRQELSPYARVVTYHGTYLEGLGQAASLRGRRPMLVLFLGSSIGNFDPQEARVFLGELRSRLRSGDLLLIGFDLIKSAREFLDAYDDPTGVTAAFNLNLLARINRELGGRFELRRFAHEARYDPAARRVEMHLRSLTAQSVTIAAAGQRFRFREGETIWTESSYKYLASELPATAKESGFREVAQWIDAAWPFAECLWMVE